MYSYTCSLHICVCTIFSYIDDIFIDFASIVYIDDTSIYRGRDTGWRRLIGSPKLQIIFHKRATKYRSLLQKLTCKDKGSYGPSYVCGHNVHIYSIHIYMQRLVYAYSDDIFIYNHNQSCIYGGRDTCVDV